MRNKKTLTILLVVMVMAVVIVPTFAFADDFTGSITISSNNVPTIDAFTVTKSAVAVTSLAPTDTVQVDITVSDADTFSNITEIMLLFWHTTTSGTPTDLGTFTQGDNTDSPTVFWVSVYNGVTFEPDVSNTTWSATAPAGGDPDGTEGTFSYSFNVTIGEEALEAAGTDTDKWAIGLKVTDANSNTAFALPTGSESAMLMAWYGMMYPQAGAGPQWYSGTPGMAYADEPAQVFDSSYYLDVIANGDYTFEVSASTAWTNTVPTTITYNNLLANPDEFSLAVDTTSTYNAGTAIELPNAAAAIAMTPPGDLSLGYCD